MPIAFDQYVAGYPEAAVTAFAADLIFVTEITFILSVLTGAKCLYPFLNVRLLHH